MSIKTTVVLLVLLLAGLAVAMFVATPAAGPAALPPKIVQFARADVRSLDVKNRHGEVHLERDGTDRERWRVKAGTSLVRADSQVVEDLLNDLSRMAPTNVFGETEVGPQDRGKWGLEPAPVAVTLGLEAGPAGIEFGNRISQNAWARKPGSPEVYLVPSFALDRLETLEVGGIREKRPVGWSSYEARALSLKRADGLELEAQRSTAASWEVTKPFRGAAEPTAMEDLLSKLLNLGVDAFASDGAPDLEKHGLLEPLAVISARREGRDAPVTIRLSRPREDGKCFFVEDGEPSVYEGGKELAAAVQVLDSAKLRDRNLLRLGWAKVQSIELVHPDRGWKLLRVLERWDLEKPERVPAAEEEVEALLKALRELEATAFLDGEDAAAHGLAAKEDASVRLVLEGVDESGTRTLLLGKRREDGGAVARLLESPGSKEANPVAVIPGAFLDLLESGWLHWRSREVLEVPLAEVRGLSRRKEGREESFVRENSAWGAAAGGPEPDGEALTAALTQLLHLDCIAFEGRAKEGLEKWGLGDPPAGPAITITLRREGEAEPRTRTLILGAEAEGGGSYYARMADGDLVFRLPSHHVSGSNIVPLVEVLKDHAWSKPPAQTPPQEDPPKEPPPEEEKPK